MWHRRSQTVDSGQGMSLNELWVTRKSKWQCEAFGRSSFNLFSLQRIGLLLPLALRYVDMILSETFYVSQELML